MNLTSEVVLAIVSLSLGQDNLSSLKGVTVLSRVPPSPARQSFCGQTERVSTPRIVKDRKPNPDADKIKDRILDTCFVFSLSDQVHKGSYRTADPSFPLSAVTKMIDSKSPFFGETSNFVPEEVL